MDVAQRKAWAGGILVAAFKRLLWESAVAQEQAGSAKHYWGVSPSHLAHSPGYGDPAHLARSQAPGLVGCGVLRGDPGADKAPQHSDSASPCPSHQLQETI